MTRRAVVFDLDGTLVDSRLDIARSLSHTLDVLGHPARSLEEIFSYIGEGLRVLVERGLPGSARTDAEIDRGVQVFRTYYMLHPTDQTEPYAGVVEALDGLQERGVLLAILTNKQGEVARLVVERLGLAGRFEVILGGGDVPELKPQPSGLLACCARLGVAPADAWYVGDLPLDVETARRAGTRSAAAAWGYGDRDALEAEGPHVLLQSAAGILGLS